MRIKWKKKLFALIKAFYASLMQRVAWRHRLAEQSNELAAPATIKKRNCIEDNAKVSHINNFQIVWAFIINTISVKRFCFLRHFKHLNDEHTELNTFQFSSQLANWDRHGMSHNRTSLHHTKRFRERNCRPESAFTSGWCMWISR